MPVSEVVGGTQISASWWRTAVLFGALLALIYWVGSKIYAAVPSWGSVGRLFTRIFRG